MKKGAAVEFVPFEPAISQGPAEPGPRLKVVPKPGSGSPSPPDFTPVDSTSGTPIATTSSHHTHGTAGASPIVSLQRDGDRITVIRVECSCGQVIELNCSYSNP